jgi:hypothetical protein
MFSKTSLLSLPAELKLDIFSLLAKSSDLPPIMARDVAWAFPPAPVIYQQTMQSDGENADSVLDANTGVWKGPPLKSLRLYVWTAVSSPMLGTESHIGQCMSTIQYTLYTNPI